MPKYKTTIKYEAPLGISLRDAVADMLHREELTDDDYVMTYPGMGHLTFATENGCTVEEVVSKTVPLDKVVL